MGQNQPKKLVLNRETVRDLTKDELVGIEGGKGGFTDGGTCESCGVPLESRDTIFPCCVCP